MISLFKLAQHFYIEEMLQFFRQNFKIIALLTKIEKLESFGAEITHFLPDKTFTVNKSIYACF